MSFHPSNYIRRKSIGRLSCSIIFTSLLFISLSAVAQIPASQHVVLVIEENHSYSQVVSGMTWLVSKGNANGYATNYFADGGGSLKDYLWLASGSCHNASVCSPLPAGTHDFGCTGDTCSSPITDDNIFREMNNAGISWKVYAETYNQAGGTPTSPDNTTIHYYRRHNGATWYSDILSDVSGSASKIVDFSQFGTDLANNALPRFSIIVPNGLDDAHDGTLAQADTFLQSNLDPMLAKSYFQPGGDGMLLVTFDECGAGTNTGCGPVYTAIIGPKVVPHTVSGTATSMKMLCEPCWMRWNHCPSGRIGRRGIHV